MILNKKDLIEMVYKKRITYEEIMLIQELETEIKRMQELIRNINYKYEEQKKEAYSWITNTL